MVVRYGMSDKLGTVLYGAEHSADEVFLGRDFSSGKDYSERTAAEIDDEIRSIIRSAYERCEKILSEHVDKLHFVAKFLLRNEFMDEDQFRAAMESVDPTFEQIEAIAEERKRKSEEENKTAHERNAKQEELEREREELARQALEENKISGAPLITEDLFNTSDSEEPASRDNNSEDDVDFEDK